MACLAWGDVARPGHDRRGGADVVGLVDTQPKPGRSHERDECECEGWQAASHLLNSSSTIRVDADREQPGITARGDQAKPSGQRAKELHEVGQGARTALDVALPQRL